MDEEGGGEGKGDAGESEFGFVTVDRTHTLKSFASYADWVKALHFSEPLPQVRQRLAHALQCCIDGTPGAALGIKDLHGGRGALTRELQSSDGSAGFNRPALQLLRAKFLYAAGRVLRGTGGAHRRTRRRARPSGASCARTAARSPAWRRSRASSGALWRRPTRCRQGRVQASMV